MVIFKNAEERLAENYVYELVAKELQEGFRKDGLWLRGATESEGDEQKARRLYVRYRVQEIKDKLNSKAQLDEEEALAAARRPPGCKPAKVVFPDQEPTSMIGALGWILILLVAPMGIGVVVAQMILELP